MVNIELAGETGRGIPVVDAQLAPGAVTVGIDGGLRHPELAGDLLRRKVLIDKAQAFTLSWREKPRWIIQDVRPCAHVLYT